MRIPVTAYIGATPWASFRIDLAGDELRMTGQPEDVPPLARVTLPGLSQRGYRVYPLVDHLADKIIATIQRHGPMRKPSTRYKDLVDLVAIVTAASVAADEQIRALISEAERREVSLPASFDIPNRALWESAMRPKHVAHSSRRRLCWTRLLLSFAPSWIRSLTGARGGYGSQWQVAGYSRTSSNRQWGVDGHFILGRGPHYESTRPWIVAGKVRSGTSTAMSRMRADCLDG